MFDQSTLCEPGFDIHCLCYKNFRIDFIHSYVKIQTTNNLLFVPKSSTIQENKYSHIDSSIPFVAVDLEHSIFRAYRFQILSKSINIKIFAFWVSFQCINNKHSLFHHKSSNITNIRKSKSTSFNPYLRIIDSNIYLDFASTICSSMDPSFHRFQSFHQQTKSKTFAHRPKNKNLRNQIPYCSFSKHPNLDPSHIHLDQASNFPDFALIIQTTISKIDLESWTSISAVTIRFSFQIQNPSIEQHSSTVFNIKNIESTNFRN